MSLEIREIADNELKECIGFIQLGSIPKGFLTKNGEYEDIIPHYIEL